MQDIYLPAGCSDNDPYFDMPNAHEDDFDDENMCGVFVDLGERCGKGITSTVEEPFTPGRFQIECCSDCANDFVSNGYRRIR